MTSSSNDVLATLALLGRAGVTAWVDGGWGVDALLGVISRVHSDLDLAHQDLMYARPEDNQFLQTLSRFIQSR